MNKPRVFFLSSDEQTFALFKDEFLPRLNKEIPLQSACLCSTFSSGSMQSRFYLNYDGNAWLAGTLTQASDKRLKKDIKPLENSLSRLLNLQGVTYVWKNPSLEKDEQLGLIAQDVQREFPQAVKKNKDGYLSVAYQNLIAPTIEAIKELYSRVTDNKKEIETLKKENQELKDYLCKKDPSAPFCKK